MGRLKVNLLMRNIGSKSRLRRHSLYSYTVLLHSILVFASCRRAFYKGSLLYGVPVCQDKRAVQSQVLGTVVLVVLFSATREF